MKLQSKHLVMQPDPLKVRPQSPWMDRTQWVGKVDSGRLGSGRLLCFHSSSFTLPGGSDEEVEKAFKAAFGVDLPHFNFLVSLLPWEDHHTNKRISFQNDNAGNEAQTA